MAGRSPKYLVPGKLMTHRATLLNNLQNMENESGTADKILRVHTRPVSRKALITCLNRAVETNNLWAYDPPCTFCMVGVVCRHNPNFTRIWGLVGRADNDHYTAIKMALTQTKLTELAVPVCSVL